MKWQQHPNFELSVDDTICTSKVEMAPGTFDLSKVLILGDVAFHECREEEVAITLVSRCNGKGHLPNYFRVGIAPAGHTGSWNECIWYGGNGFMYVQQKQHLVGLKKAMYLGDQVIVHWEPQARQVKFSVNASSIAEPLPVGRGSYCLVAAAYKGTMLKLSGGRKRSRDVGDTEHFAAKRAKEQLESGLFSDAVVHCGERSWSVHRSFLASASTVLRRMLETPMVEGSTSTIKITQCQPETVHELLNYIYTGSAPVLRATGVDSDRGQSIVRLLEQAQAYEIESLSEACWDILFDTSALISASIVVPLARLARNDPRHEHRITDLVWAVNGNAELIEALIRSG
ncbi:Tdpoz5 [Symbiodinium natans]|uniref:Tdpoz5 protein n=1 Tax=Symbiodinium natans TaxID=878477 RepID=A0A812GTI1_9DINO|nr:Tdpoz5 [Symbiodinium natans]